MLYTNGNLLNLSSKSGSYEFFHLVTDYQEKTLELRRQFPNGIIQIRARRESKIDPVTKRYIEVPLMSIPFEGHTIEYTTDHNPIPVEWVYSRKPLSKSPQTGSLHIDEPLMTVRRGVLYLDFKRDPELAYYVIFKSGQVDQKKAGGKRKFYIYNEVDINKATAVSRRREARLSAAIYDDLDIPSLLLIAKKNGISSPDTMDIEVVRNLLYDRVHSNEMKILSGSASKGIKGIDDFIRDIDIDTHTQIGALLQDAIDNGVLLYNDYERRWEIDNGEGHANYILMDIPSGLVSNKDDILIDFLISDSASLDRLRKAMGNTVETDISITEKYIKSIHNVPKLRKMIMELLKFKPNAGLKKPELQDLLITELKMQGRLQKEPEEVKA